MIVKWKKTMKEKKKEKEKKKRRGLIQTRGQEEM